ncbi:LacI family transcriptional regulator [Anaerobacterium chartisolvens]|uniref:LacI family transcriptional regulator n=1 Tax=Anaerobacterium chartisolvens TaxID=1297424 RepID=A0A369ATQ3_9FIRM|nr:LacI family DNA-binding transcriptional regulator [Anaerobacterium chartisolvens]RCX12719.1 LacI family transcriptional regulator [Anaerobacterium chartisolvens]
MSVTVKDVARHAEVSASTVSRVINDDPRISEKTKRRVMESIKILRYKINNIARSLKTNRTHSIGFICPELPNAFFMGIAGSIEEELGKHGYSIIICGSNENVVKEEERINLLREKCVDGIIVIPASDEGKHFNQLKESGMPLVLVDRLVNNIVADAVLVDNVNGSYSAIEYLIGKGIKRIGFIGGDMRLTSAKERYEGYIRALNDYCVPIEEQIIKFGDFHVESGYKAMASLMALRESPHNIFISNYFMHVGAVKYLIENAGALSHEVSISNFDDMELSSILGFSGVRIRQPVGEIGINAARLILQIINKGVGDSPQIVRLKTFLIT